MGKYELRVENTQEGWIPTVLWYHNHSGSYLYLEKYFQVIFVSDKVFYLEVHIC